MTSNDPNNKHDTTNESPTTTQDDTHKSRSDGYDSSTEKYIESGYVLPPGTTLKVSGLSSKVTTRDIENLFKFYGWINDIHKVEGEQGIFGVSFELDSRASDAVKDWNGRVFKGCVLSVELYGELDREVDGDVE